MCNRWIGLLAGLGAVLIMGGCDGPAVSAPSPSVSALLGPGGGSRAYETVGHCDRSILIDPGRARRVDGLLILRGHVFECPLSGDIAGVIRVRWRRAVFHDYGTPEMRGHVTGTTTLKVESFFGRRDLQGGFTGEFSASLEDLLFGVSRTTRHGTGDFRGVVLHAEFYQKPPASNHTIERGRIVGR